MSRMRHTIRSLSMLIAIAIGLAGRPFVNGQTTDNTKPPAGVCAVIGLPDGGAGAVVELAKSDGRIVYFQAASEEVVATVRQAGLDADVLGRRLFVDQGDERSIHLADNLADAAIVSPTVAEAIRQAEVLRVLRPLGRAQFGDRVLTKPLPDNIDAWSHPYHGPDNNPQSSDQKIVAPYLTQFMAKPLFSPMPVVTVAAGGRIFRAHGHIAHKANQNALLNTLLCMNGYNGAILWRRPLPEGFMIHRNTMIATPEYLYMGDNESCKRIDAATGQIVDEIVVPEGLADGPVWKWMALKDGVLYALVGAQEISVATQTSRGRGLGHWPWGMWQGHDYSHPESAFGFGRTFLAFDVESKRLLWDHTEQDYVDGRGVCMGEQGIFFYSPERLLGCLDPATGRAKWKTASAELLAAIGPNAPAQHYLTGYSTSSYIKCHDSYVFFAGPQRPRLVVVSATDGALLWTRQDGNLQLVLRDDGIYAAGAQNKDVGCVLDYETGKVLAKLPHRRACTRATGSSDSVFYRASGGTVRIVTGTNSAQHIAPMRPPCQDGVLVANGMLYWGPWMCGCQLSAYGHIGLAAAGGLDVHPGLDDSRMEYRAPNLDRVEPLEIRDGDWPTYCGDNQRSFRTTASLPRAMLVRWSAKTTPGVRPTAPVTAGGLVFAGDRSGVLRAWDTAGGKLRWQAFTAGPIFGTPAVDGGRVFVGSGDGRVYAFEAATGRALWRFRAAPVDRWICVYDQLVSTWPAAGGLVVQDGVVYVAAGIHHYDGIHVYALDATTGEVRWYNDSSGVTSPTLNHGVSLQGELYIRDGELRFLGGGVHEVARYDLTSGRCLNQPHDDITSMFPSAFYAYYPEYGKFRSLDVQLADGRRLVYDASYEGSVHGPLSLLQAGVRRPPMRESRWANIRGRSPQLPSVWRDNRGRRFSAFAVTDERFLAAGEVGDFASPRPFIAAIRVADGADSWLRELPAMVVPGGIAVNDDGQVFASLEDGRLLCLAAGKAAD